MKKYCFLVLLLSSNLLVWAQNNYVVRTGNSNLPLGSYNIILGITAGNTTMTGSNNAFIGYQAGTSNTSGLANSFIGYLAGPFNTTGGYNVLLGYETGYSNTTGSSNTFLGTFAGTANTTGSNNTFVGERAGRNSTTGSNNIIIGPDSGTAITTSDDNVLMGYNAQAEDGLKNAIAIGANSRVASSNALILGNNANVGIGTSAPATRLEVVSELPDASGVRLTNLTTRSPSTQLTDQFLSVNERGDVVKASYQLRINNPGEWSDKVFASTYQLQPLASVAAYIRHQGHLPGVPSATEVVEKGVNLVKLNTILLEKVEELTLYSIQLEKNSKEQKVINQQLRAAAQQQQAKLTELERLVKQLTEKK